MHYKSSYFSQSSNISQANNDSNGLWLLQETSNIIPFPFFFGGLITIRCLGHNVNQERLRASSLHGAHGMVKVLPRIIIYKKY